MNAAYMAGFIDADGSFGIYRHNELTVQIAQVDRGVLEQIVKAYGGRIVTLREAKENQQKIYQWYLSRRDQVKTLVEDISPHLIVKKDQAEVVIEFINTYTTPFGRDKGTGMKYKKRRRHELAMRLKELKRK